MASAPPAAEELLWRQYALYADLYKTYITAVIQLSAFVYAITGGMVSYFLVNSHVVPLRWALFLPVIFNAGITILCLGSLPLLSAQHCATMEIGVRLKLTTVPSYFLLRLLLILFGILHLLTLIGLGGLLTFGWTAVNRG
jgi:hypothetical protein